MNFKPKYIRVVSDLHLEQLLGQREEFLAETFIPPDDKDAESVLVLAGDISSKPEQLIKFLGFLKDRFKKIIYVPGNHEYYGHEMVTWNENLQAALGNYFPNEEGSIVECPGSGVEIIELDGVRFIYGTLWADGGKSPKEQVEVARCLRDFYVTKVGDKKWTVSMMRDLHNAQKARIKELLATPFEGKTVVVTHHMPSLRLCHPRFGNEINGGFASNCEDILAYDDAPEVWIHGHTHDTIDMKLFNSRIVCNPSGYHHEYGTIYTQFGPKFLTIETMENLDPVKPALTPKAKTNG